MACGVPPRCPPLDGFVRPAALPRIHAVNIHQMQVRYDPGADRLLWQLRTFGGELFAIWLTRRVLRALWPPLQEQVTRAGMAALSPHAHVMPEALEMLGQVARERPLPSAQFDKPFDSTPVAQPLGTEPLLPVTLKMTPPHPHGPLVLEMQEAAGRRLTVQLSDDLATALVRLTEQALAEADWGLATTGTHAPAAPERPMTLI